MNPDSPIDPIESSLTALLLGELSHGQAAALHQKLAQDAELAKLYERLKQTINLVRETVASPAAQTSDQPTPLKLSDQRREKLLQHFKTVAPKAFVPPPRRGMSWLVPVGIAAALAVILSSMLLPALSRSKSRSQSLGFHTWSMSDEAKTAMSAAPAPDTPVELRLSSRRPSQSASPQAAPAHNAPVATPAAATLEPPPPPSAASSVIVLPQTGELASWSSEQGGSGSASQAAQGAFINRYGYLAALGQIAKLEPPAASAPSEAPAPAFKGTPKDVPVLGDMPVVGQLMRNKPGIVGAGFNATSGSLATPQSAHWGEVESGVAANTDYYLGAATNFAALGMFGSAQAPPTPPLVTTISGYAHTSGVWNFNTGDANTPLPALSSQPTDQTAAFAGRVAKVVNKAASTGSADDSAVDKRAGVEGKTGGGGTNGMNVYSLNVVGYYEVPTTATNFIAVAPADSASYDRFTYNRLLSQLGTDANGAAPATKRTIVLPQAMPETGLTLKNGAKAVQLYAADGGIKAPEERYAGQDEKVREAQKKVDDLRDKLNISDGIASGDGASPLMSAETLRHLEGLRIERKAELVREQTLVDRLKELGKEQDAEKLAARVFSLSNSLDNLEKEVEKATGNDVAPPAEYVSEVIPIKHGKASDMASALNSLSSKGGGTSVGGGKADSAPKVAPKPAVPAPIPQPEVQTADNAFSTFSLNVSDVSFKLAAASLEKGVMPEPATVRSEEFINAFDYRDPEPPAGVPVAFAWERAQYPFAQNRDLLRFSIKTAAQGRQPGRPLNLVLLLDNSGSMERADRVRIIHEALRVLAGQLQPQDKFSVVTFARTAHLWVDGVPGDQAAKVAEEVSGLTPQGGTNLEDAMNLAYQTALRHYLANGINRVVLLTDGAANLGNVDPEALKQKVEANRKQGIALDCFGIGWEGYNDDLLEVLTRNGDGRYAFLNSPEEVADELAAKLAGALQVAASDVKVQVEFNPARVTAYRQIGYAKHQLTKEQFRDNTVNAAQIGAAEAGNALYTVEVNPNGTGPLCTVRVRFRIPGTADYREHMWDVPFNGNAVTLEQASPAMRLAATGSALSEWLASSPYAGEVTPDRLLDYLSGVSEVYGADARPKKLEWMIRQAKSIAGQ